MAVVPQEYLNQYNSPSKPLPNQTNLYGKTPVYYNQARQAVVPTQSGGGGGGNNTPSAPNPTDVLRNQISSGWDAYTNQLGGLLSGLDPQRQAQENIINSQYGQGVNTLTGQKEQGLSTLETQRTRTTQNQEKSFRDLADNIRNSFMAGNIYLGSQGAGDSSAADQYSYGLTKLGTKQRTDISNNTANIFGDIDARESQLNKTYDTEINNLAYRRDQAINGVAQWFAEQQNKIKQMMAQGTLGKNQDLNSLSQNVLNQALSALNSIQTQSSQARDTIQKWAQDELSNIGSARSQLGQFSNVAYAQPQAQAVAGTPQVTANGGVYVPAGYGSSNDQNKLFGNNFFG